MDKKNVKVEFINDINLIEKKQWDLCACPEAFKGEKIIAAFDRILISEVGYKVTDHDKISFQGVYEHFYEDSYHDRKTSTHYVVLAYRLEVVKKFNVILLFFE